MLSFSVEFPVRPSHQSKEFLETIRLWILGSKHTNFSKSDLPELPLDEKWCVEKNSERLDTLSVRDPDYEIVAIRYVKSENTISWETEIVFSRTNFDSWVGVRTSRDSNQFSTALPPAKKPVVVKQLLQKLGEAIDGPLTIREGAHKLTNDEIPLAASLIAGSSGCYLPVVYVSSGFDGSYALDFDGLAKQLSGMAHVVLEPNRAFSARLKIEVNSANVYGGAVGIYWPNAQGRQIRYIGREGAKFENLESIVVEEIRSALLNRRPLSRCTWSAAEEALSRRVVADLKQKGSNAVEEYTEAFDAEIKAKNERIADAEKEIKRLQNEVRKLEAQSGDSADIALALTSEQDLYPNECRTFILEAIEDRFANVVDDSRRAHVLRAIISDNPSSNLLKDQREQIKNILRNYRKMDAQTRRDLERLGFRGGPAW